MGQRRRLGLIGLLLILQTALGLLSPWPVKVLVDNVLAGKELPPAVAWITGLPGGGTPTALAGWLATAMVAIFVALRLAEALRTYLESGAGERMTYELAEELFDRVQRISFSSIARTPTGDLLKRVTDDAAFVRDLVVGVAIPVFSSFLALVSMFIVMWALSPRLAIVAIAVAVPAAIIARVFSRPMTRRHYALAGSEAALVSHAEQTLMALPEVASFQREAREDAVFSRLARSTIHEGLRVQASESFYGISRSVLSALGVAAVMLVGGAIVIDGVLSVGDLLVFLSYLGMTVSVLDEMGITTTSYAKAAARARRVVEVLEFEEGVRDPVSPVDLPGLVSGGGRGVGFEGVVFGYEEGERVLDGIDLAVDAGETVALVGRTGVGKTTLVSLIPRFFDPWEGRVVMDGVDLRDLRLEEVRAQVGLVRQDPLLLPISVGENIAYGRPDASFEEVRAAAEAANAAEFIDRLPGGYDTVLVEQGASLSGGQRQRLAIARALLKDAPILVLDEPTAALDAETESLLVEALERLMQDRTTFVIAHRLSTVRHADRIVVLDQGRIVETGSHHDLLNRQGQYHHLHQLQFAETEVEVDLR
jgi:ATP-binding cassette subfamily B protein